MVATLDQISVIAGSPNFQQRVRNCLGVAAASVYAETGRVSTASTTTTLTFTSGQVPTTAVAGAPVFDLTNPGAIPAGTTVVSTTATTVVMSAAATAVVALDQIAFVFNHGARAEFAQKVIAGQYDILDICEAVLGNSTIAAEATGVQPDFNIPDSDIQFAVNSLWNLFAGA